MQTKTKDVKKDFQGMNTMIQSSRIPARACRDMQDCVVRKGVVRTRDGYTKEGVQLFDKVLSMYHCRSRVGVGVGVEVGAAQAAMNGSTVSINTRQTPPNRVSNFLLFI